MTTTTSGERVLIVEDEPSTRLGLTELVRTWGFTTDSAADGEEALQRITVFRPSIIISDLVMPRMGGLELLRALKDDGGELHGRHPDRAGHRRDRGRSDQGRRLRLPDQADRAAAAEDPARQDRRAAGHAARGEGAAASSCASTARFGRMIGSSSQMRKVYQVVEQAAPTSASVLIWGESGTGKELVAQTIHQLSPRAQQPFVPINCAAIPETLLESEIFGHEKGAFTGASDRREGCFELADRGTLFLDEIAEMTPATQVKLLRVLQERKFRRLGGRSEQSVDVRVIAATNVNPAEAVKSGKLREDLLLPAERLRHRAAAAAPAQGGPAAADPVVPRRVQRAQQQARVGASTRRRCASSSSTTGRATCASCATSSSAPSS